MRPSQPLKASLLITVTPSGITLLPQPKTSRFVLRSIQQLFSERKTGLSGETVMDCKFGHLIKA